jgi:hypothetical protein
MSQTLKTSVAVIGVDIDKISFHLVGQDWRGAIVGWRAGASGSSPASITGGASRPRRSMPRPR